MKRQAFSPERIADEVRLISTDFFNNVVNKKAGVSGAKIFCNEDWLQVHPDADGQASTQADILTGKTWRIQGSKGLQKYCDNDPKPLAFFNAVTKYITICPHSWPRYARATLATSRMGNYNGVLLWRVGMPFSYALLHEMLHAGSVVYRSDGSIRLRGRFPFTRTCASGLSHLPVIQCSISRSAFQFKRAILTVPQRSNKPMDSRIVSV